MPYKHFLGYEKNEDGTIKINEEEAKVVRRIYYQFLKGDSVGKIANDLTSIGIKTPAGKSEWRKTSVISILQNEKYKGDALLQKKFTVDFLNHKTKKNEGEDPQYYVHDSHPAIITKEDWELVQIELSRRKEMGYTYSFKNPFSGKFICEDCGSYYGKKKWHSGTPNEKEILQCNFKFKHKCKTPNLDEEEVKSMFLKAYNEMIMSKDVLISNLIEAVNKDLDTSALDKQIETLTKELNDMNKEFELHVKMNTTTQQDQTIWRKKYAELENIYKNKEIELNSLVDKKNEIKLKVSKFSVFIETLKRGEVITDWDDAIFNFNLEKAIVHKDKSITFKFYSGFETTIKAEE